MIKPTSLQSIETLSQDWDEMGLEKGDICIRNHHPAGQRLQLFCASNEAYNVTSNLTGSFMQGGCLILAKALAETIPDGKLYVVTRASKPGVIEHYIYGIENPETNETVYLDADGMGSRKDIIEKLNEFEGFFISDCDLTPLDQYLAEYPDSVANSDIVDTDWQKLADLLQQTDIAELLKADQLSPR